MTDDLVGRLRNYGVCLNPETAICSRAAVDEAADRLEAMQVKDVRSRALSEAAARIKALEALVERAAQVMPLMYVNWHASARAALTPEVLHAD